MSAQSFSTLVSRGVVKDVTYLTASSTQTLSDELATIKVSEYRDARAASTSPVSLGIVAEDAPASIRSADGKGVDLLKLSAMIVASVQEQKKKLDGLHIDLINDEIIFNKALRVTSMATFGGGLSVDTISSIGASLTFNTDTAFFGRPYFNTDTAGFAVIGEGARDVEVVFDKEYLEQPIVNASIALDDVGDDQTAAALEAIFNNDVRFLITKKSTKGFTITLNKPAPRDIQFSWITLAVKGARTATSTHAEIIPPAPVQPAPIPQLEIVNDQDQGTTTDPVPEESPVETSIDTTTTVGNGSDDVIESAPSEIVPEPTPIDTSLSGTDEDGAPVGLP
jgi:hypothetical protein